MVDYSIEYSNGVFIGITSGDAEVERFGDLLDAMLTHDEWQPGMPWLHDHTNLNSGPLTVNDVQRIAQLCAERSTQLGRGKCAIIGARDLEFGLIRMWSIYVERQWDVVTKVFRSREEAMAWLDV